MLSLSLFQAANPGPPEGQPLFEAARAGDLAPVRELVEGGLDPDTEYRWGMTPLNAAAGWGRHEVVRDLLERGADPLDGPTDGCTSPPRRGSCTSPASWRSTRWARR